jgi:hypothetical protein
VRVGRQFDGGYVMLDDFNDVKAALSFGVSDDVSWDLEVANRGIHVYQFDDMIDQSPVQSPNFSFFKKRLASDDGPAQISLNSLLTERKRTGEDDFIIKMDIESDEWTALDSVDAELLTGCRQFVCEFHYLGRLAEKDFLDRAVRCLQKMSEVFFVTHVHGNNCGNIINVGNIALPESLEVTYVNRKRYKAEDIPQLFPTEVDMPNQEGRADIFLGSFRF